MRAKLLIAVLLVFLLIIPLASAKSVVFITGNDTCHRGSCSCLSSEETSFCNRLKTNLGYNVTIIGESYVIANDTFEWSQWANASDLIFLGSTTNRTANISSEDHQKFCSNVSLFVPAHKIFATFTNAYMNGTNTSGCAFDTPLSMVEWSTATNNSCASPSGFRKLVDGYITSGMVNEPALYTTTYPVKMHGPASPSSPVGWIGVACPNPTGVFSVVNTTDKGVFWGLDKPSIFTADAWSLFDRTIWNVLNETGWTVTPYMIPSMPTANVSAMVVAKVMERGLPINSTNTVNFTLNSVLGNLVYQSGYWISSLVTVPSVGSYTLNVTGWDPYALRGSASKSVAVGNLTVSILSGDYAPGDNYVVIANVTDNGTFVPANVNVTIWNYTSWTPVSSSVMSSPGAYYTMTIIGIQTAGWREPLLIEVTAINGSYSGGNYKQINIATFLSGNLTSDKTSYKPGELVSLNLMTNATPNVTAVNMTVLDPANISTPLGTMTRINSTLWTLNYTLSPSSLNGTHTFNASFTDGVRTSWASSRADVKAYDLYFSKNKAVYSTGEPVVMTVQILNPYTTGINFSIVINVTSPSNNTTVVGNGNISGAGSWNTSWTIPMTSPEGSYKINASIKDSANPLRMTFLTDTFSVNATPYVSVSPISWSLNATAAKRYNQTFVINNSGAVDFVNMTIVPSSGIAPFVDITSANISSLPHGNTTNFTVGWNASAPVNLSGTITIAAVNQSLLASIPVTLSMSASAGPPPVQNWLSVNPATLIMTTTIVIITNSEFTLSNSGTADLTDITVNVGDELTGIVKVTEKPDRVPASGTAILKLSVDTTDATEGVRAGTIAIRSSSGSTEITANIKIVGNLAEKADTLYLQLAGLSANVSDLADKGKNVTSIRTLIEAASAAITAARSAWQAGDYETADTKISEAESSIGSIQTALTSLATAPIESKKVGGVIWAVAAVIIIMIVGLTVFKFKDQLKALIDRLLKRKPKAPPSQPQEYGSYPEQEQGPPPEEAPPEEEREGRYRTEWY